MRIRDMRCISIISSRIVVVHIFKDNFKNFKMAFMSSIVKRCISFIVSRIFVIHIFKEKVTNFKMAFLSSCMKWCYADQSCADARLTTMAEATGQYFSYAVCGNPQTQLKAITAANCPWLAKADPCSCLGQDLSLIPI